MSPNGIVIHHSATRDSGTVSWEAIRRYHTEVKGWLDIGYHFGVERIEDAFQIMGGRPAHRAGAHTVGRNTMLGVCLVGDYDRESPPPDALEVLQRLVLGLLIAHNLAPEDVHFHDEYSAKSCPGLCFPRREFLKKLEAAWIRCKGG